MGRKDYYRNCGSEWEDSAPARNSWSLDSIRRSVDGSHLDEYLSNESRVCLLNPQQVLEVASSEETKFERRGTKALVVVGMAVQSFQHLSFRHLAFADCKPADGHSKYVLGIQSL